MATLNLCLFTDESSIRSIKPCLLLQLLAPHEPFFRKHGCVIPQTGSSAEINYDALREVLLNLDAATPPELIDALYFVSEMATTAGMDALLPALSARVRDAESEGADDHAPIDVAIEAWLVDPEYVQERHAESHLERPRSFEYFQTHNAPHQEFDTPSVEVRRGLEKSLDEWFCKHRRGEGARVFVFPRADGVWFLVRHGEPYRRESSMEHGEPKGVAYRPMKFDVIVYDQSVGEIRINAETQGEKTLYRQQFGRHLFGSENFFPGTGKYTLTPLQTDGASSLMCSDIDGMEWVRLKEVHFYWGGASGELEIRKAKDIFAMYEERGSAFPRTRITKAVFEVKFADSKNSRSVTIRPSNVAQYTRDHDAAHVEEWLARRGFVLARDVIVEIKPIGTLARA